MKIDRNNYRIWLTDLADGKLGEEQASMVLLFLNENPDLLEEADGLFSFTLVPGREPFISRTALYRRPEDLGGEQFTLLSVARLENDISPAQEEELEYILSNSAERRKEHELIQKLKLRPGTEEYKFKSTLLRKSRTAVILRISTAITAVAAVITLIITFWFSGPHNSGIQAETKLASVAREAVPPATETLPSPQAASQLKGRAADENPVSKTRFSQNENPKDLKIVTNVTIQEAQIPAITREAAPETILLASAASVAPQAPAKLLALSFQSSAGAYPVDDRSRIGRFLAMNFREKILKQDVPSDAPLKGFEIAEAGVNGLNKILGWEMALGANTTETGDVRSIYFNSRLLRFSTPVKKAQPAP